MSFFLPFAELFAFPSISPPTATFDDVVFLLEVWLL
jgi:hypothetical protein